MPTCWREPSTRQQAGLVLREVSVMLGTLSERVWLHLGARTPEHAPRLARLAGGAVLQAPGSHGALLGANNMNVPFLLQHDGRGEEQELSLLGSEGDWLTHQTAASALTSRVRWVPAPGSPADESLAEAVAVARDFVRFAERECPSQPRLGLFAVDHRWLSSQSPRQMLIGAMRAVEAPVGIMLGKGRDPLDTARAVEGLVELIQRVDQVVVLRCDHGALGAFAFGAAGGAIGIGTSTRHYVPPDEGSWADLTDPTPRVFLPTIMAWWKGSRLAYYEGDPLFNCPCEECQGASLARFQDERLRIAADAHSVCCWSAIARDLESAAPTERTERWIALCQRAYGALDELEEHGNGLLEPPSRQLKAWLRFVGIPAA